MQRRMRRNQGLGVDLITGTLAGAVATWVMERVTTSLYEQEEAAPRQREDEIRQGKHAFAVAAEKTAGLTGGRLSEAQQQKLGIAYPWGLGLGAGAIYGALRRRIGWLDSGHGAVFGVWFFLLIDEAMNTALRLTPPPQAFPWQAHARGLAGHLVYGLIADTGAGCAGSRRVAAQL